jgi:hypothetical protein
MNPMIRLLFISLTVVCFTSPLPTLAQTTSFSYQGNLDESGEPAQGDYDFKFALFDAAEDGNQVGPIITRLGVPVRDGFFAVRLNFGESFPGDERFLEIKVRPTQAVPEAYTGLMPRRRLTSAPYAIKSRLSNEAANAQKLGNVDADQYIQTTDERLNDSRAPTAGSPDYIQNRSSQQAASEFNISGEGTADRFNALGTGGYRLDGVSVLQSIGGDTSSIRLGNAAPIAGSRYTLVGTGTSALAALDYASAFGAGALVTSSNTVVLGRAADTVTIPGNLRLDGILTNGLPTGSPNYVQNTTVQQLASNFNISGDGTVGGTLTGGVVSSTTHFSIGSERMLGALGSNTFAGLGAGANSVIGGDNWALWNSFFGKDAGQDNVGGDFNSFFGRTAGQRSLGNGNSFFGATAGDGTTTGESNTFIGFSTGTTNELGSNNTALGKGADVGSDNLTYATVVGSNAVVTSSKTIQLGRDGFDVVRVGILGSAGATPVCLNASSDAFSLFILKRLQG